MFQTNSLFCIRVDGNIIIELFQLLCTNYYNGFVFVFDWCLCMAIDVSVQHNGGFLSGIIVLTQCYYYYHRGTRLNAIKSFVFAGYDPT